MKVLLSGALALVVVAAGILYVGFAGSSVPPAFTARALDVYNLDKCGQHKWIHITDSSVVSTILVQRSTANKKAAINNIVWIGGVVTLDPAEPGGWKFDPSHVLITDRAPEGMQTTTCKINE